MSVLQKRGLVFHCYHYSYSYYYCRYCYWYYYHNCIITAISLFTSDFIENTLKLQHLKIQIYLTVSNYHVTYGFKSETALYSCLNVKQLLSRNRCNIGSLSKSNGIRTHNHLVYKQRLNGIGANGTGIYVRDGIYERNVCAFESRCCHLNFRYHACFE